VDRLSRFIQVWIRKTGCLGHEQRMIANSGFQRALHTGIAYLRCSSDARTPCASSRICAATIQTSGRSCGRIEEQKLEAGRAELTTQEPALTHLAQKHEDAEGEPQPSPVPDHTSHESDLPSEADSQKYEGNDGSDAPGSQNAPARSLLLRRALRWDGIVHGSPSCHLPLGLNPSFTSLCRPAPVRSLEPG
jgi:hypothetical protein